MCGDDVTVWYLAGCGVVLWIKVEEVKFAIVFVPIMPEKQEKLNQDIL